MPSDPREWIAVSMLPGLGPATLAKLAAKGITPTAILSKQLPATLRFRADTRHALNTGSIQPLLDKADAIIALSYQKNLSILTIDSHEYPALLREINDPPPVLSDSA